MRSNFSNRVEKPAIVKHEALRAAWKTRRVKAALGAHVSVTTGAFSNETLVEGGTDEDLKALAETFPDARVKRSNARFLTVEWDI